jgi:hypothetical protein
VEEANEAELQDLRELLRMLGKIDPWIKAVTTDGSSRPWVADSHSPLSTDDRRTHPYRLRGRTDW